ncbi:MAG: CvpA family protein [Bacteroidota bacterium]
MNSFYILLITAILTGCLIGYLAGFIKLLFFFIKISATIAATYFLHPFITGFINDNISIDTAWVQAIAFMILFIPCFILFHFLIYPVQKRTSRFNKKFLNRAAGIVTGLACGVISVVSITQFRNITTLPQEVSSEIKARGLEDVFNNYANLVNDKFAPFFQEQPVQVMASKTVDSIIEKGISLSFVTDKFEEDPTLEADMLQLINDERAKYGLRSLVADAQLTNAARMHSADMFRRGYFSHNTPEGINPFQRLHKLNIVYLYAGENLAMAPTLLKAHEGLMRSPGHRANILNPSYGKVGIGILDAGTHGLMITQEFRD